MIESYILLITSIIVFFSSFYLRREAFFAIFMGFVAGLLYVFTSDLHIAFASALLINSGIHSYVVNMLRSTVGKREMNLIRIYFLWVFLISSVLACEGIILPLIASFLSFIAVLIWKKRIATLLSLVSALLLFIYLDPIILFCMIFLRYVAEVML